MNCNEIQQIIAQGKTSLGIELGSTRIKAILIGSDHMPIAGGTYDWENQYKDGIWTYSISAVWEGIQESYRKLCADILERYEIALTTVGSLGFSGMMHGYLPFDKAGNLLTPFRTWRNTNTAQAAAELTNKLGFNIPQRWSVAHLWQAILNGEAHVSEVDYITTLSGYVHWQVTGNKFLGVGDASGMFPIDSTTSNFDSCMATAMDVMLAQKNLKYKLIEILPTVMSAGEVAGTLTELGARLIDPTGTLQVGIPLCPPEGDAGTGMVATNSIAPRTGNVSAGTSVFAMLVLEQKLSRVYTEIDMVTTPSGAPVAMAHCNTCTSDLDAWVKIFDEFGTAQGACMSRGKLYDLLYQQALEGEPDCGGMISYNYYSGEPITETSAGRPLFVRTPDSRFTLANFMRMHLYSTMATLKLGLDILFEKEHVQLDRLLGHGGLFKTPIVGQKLMAGALGVPVAVMETAGEGGPWGMAILAAYMVNRSNGESLAQYLDQRVFSGIQGQSISPDPSDTKGFSEFMARYQSGLAIEKSAISALNELS